MWELLGHVADRSVLGRSLQMAMGVAEESAMDGVVQVLEMNLCGMMQTMQGRSGGAADRSRRPLCVAWQVELQRETRSACRRGTRARTRRTKWRAGVLREWVVH